MCDLWSIEEGVSGASFCKNGLNFPLKLSSLTSWAIIFKKTRALKICFTSWPMLIYKMHIILLRDICSEVSTKMNTRLEKLTATESGNVIYIIGHRLWTACLNVSQSHYWDMGCGVRVGDKETPNSWWEIKMHISLQGYALYNLRNKISSTMAFHELNNVSDFIW